MNNLFYNFKHLFSPTLFIFLLLFSTPIFGRHSNEFNESNSYYNISDKNGEIENVSTHYMENMSIKNVNLIGLSGQFIYYPGSKELISFIGLCNEKYLYNPLFSHYGSLAFGFSNLGPEVIKIPVIGITLLSITSFISLLANKNLFLSWEKYFIDGFAININLGDVFYISPYTGLFTAFNIISPNALVGLEGGLKLNFFFNNKLRANITGGSLFDLINNSFTYNISLSISYFLFQ